MRIDWKKAVYSAPLRLLLVAAGAALLAVLVEMFRYRCATGDANAILIVPFVLLYLFGIFLVTKGRFTGVAPVSFLAILVLSGLSLLIRYGLFDLFSSDYSKVLSSWLAAFQSAPGLKGFGITIGDYNVPYLYLLTGIAKTMPKETWPYGIKLVSMAFELVLAYYVMRIVSLRSGRYAVQCAAFFAVLFAPTVFGNSGIFVQCDAIYTAFAVGALYYGLCGKSRLCWLFMALSFSFKMQAVFLMPVLFVLLFIRRIRLRDCWLFPATFSALLVPAIVAGREAWETFTIYFHQARFYLQLTLQAPTAYSLFYTSDYSLYASEFTENRIYSFAGIFFAGAVCCILLLYLYRIRRRLRDSDVLDGALLFALLIPLFLPHMHERYFFCADVLSIVYLFNHRSRWYVPFTVILVSFLCCFTEAPSTSYPVSLGVMGIAMLAVTALTAYRFYADTAKPDMPEEAGELPL